MRVGVNLGPDRSYCFARETLGPFRTYFSDPCNGLSQVAQNAPVPAPQPDPRHQRKQRPQQHHVRTADIDRVIAGITLAPDLSDHMHQRIPPQEIALGQGDRFEREKHAGDQKHRPHAGSPRPLPERDKPDQQAVHRANAKAQHHEQPRALCQDRDVRRGACFAEKQDAPSSRLATAAWIPVASRNRARSASIAPTAG